MNIDLSLPEHAIRYLTRMLKRERARLADVRHHSLPLEAAFDSLDALECSIPDEIWDGEQEPET